MLIKITASPYSKGTTLDVNGQRAFVPEAGKTTEIPDWMLPSLDSSGITYEIVGAADEAGGGAEGDSGDPPAEVAVEPDPPAEEQEADSSVNDADEKDYITALSVLDGSVASITAVLPELSDDAVRALLAAEMGGKTRKTLIAAMDERLNPPTE